MLNRCLTLLFTSVILAAGHAQTITGRVLDDTTGEGIFGATVEVTDSLRSRVTVSRQDGSFELTEVPQGNVDLICRAVKYIDYPTVMPLLVSGLHVRQDIPLLLKTRDSEYVRLAAARAAGDQGFAERLASRAAFDSAARADLLVALEPLLTTKQARENTVALLAPGSQKLQPTVEAKAVNAHGPTEPPTPGKEQGEVKTAWELDRAEEAGYRAQAAGDATYRADSVAERTTRQADYLYTAVNNIDNYRLVDTQKVYFQFGKSELTPEGTQALDQAVAQLGTVKNYAIELVGFVDRAGNKNFDVALSQRRAEAVEHYLTEHNVPLRRIHVVGVGADESNGRTATERREDRRVDIRIYALDMSGEAATQSSSSSQAPAGTNSAADRMVNTAPTATEKGRTPAAPPPSSSTPPTPNTNIPMR